MKKILLSLLVFCSGSLCLASTIPQARALVAQMASETHLLVGNCKLVTPTATQLKHQLADLGAGLNSFVPTPYIENALENISLAIRAVDFSLDECINYHGQDDSDGKNLLEIYLNNIDTDLKLTP